MSVKELQKYTFVSKYARYNEAEKRRETWKEAVHRMRDMHLRKYPQAASLIREAFESVYEQEILGSQRALQFGGTAIERINERSYNCTASFCDRLRFFQESLFLLLAGCGVGFSVQKHHVAKLPKFCGPRLKASAPVLPRATHKVGDSIEGWSDAVGVLMSSYFEDPVFPEYYGCEVEFDYSDVRPAGSKIGSGTGKAPGPEPLRRSIEKIRELLNRCLAEGLEKLRPIHAYDIVMHASDAVLSGGVRRSAAIAVFSLDDEEMMTAKTGNWFYENPQRARSNNSVLLLRGQVTREQFLNIIEKTRQFGEPGFVWANHTECVYNPCVEVHLYPVDWLTGLTGWEMCNLTTINGKKVKTREDFFKRCRHAAIIGTIQAGYTNFPYLGEVSERICEREALLGVSITGIMESPDILLNEDILRDGAAIVLKTNKEVASLIGINPTARATVVKPEGCQVPGTLLVTDRGVLRLDEIGNVGGDRWQNIDLSVRKPWDTAAASKIFVNGRAETVRIKMRSGLTLEATKGHKYRVLDGQELVWREAAEIKAGDWLPYDLGGYAKFSVPPRRLVEVQKPHFNCRQITQPATLDADLAWLIGLYHGDGSNLRKGVRIYGNASDLDDLERASKIIKDKFGWEARIAQTPGTNKVALYFSSAMFLIWLRANGLLKGKSPDVGIPRTIREGGREVLAAFIDGYWAADGGVNPASGTRTFVTTSRRMADELVVCLRAIGIDARWREMPPTNGSWGKRMRYWIGERKGRLADKASVECPLGVRMSLDALGLGHALADRVMSVEASVSDTFDIEVPDGHEYVANGYYSHNTASCLLGTSSGVHLHHARLFFRRVQANTLEAPYQFFAVANPQAVERSVWSASGTDGVITFCCEAEDGALTKCDMGAVEFLAKVRLVKKAWVDGGKVEERCEQPWLSHNVSNTVNVRDDEWDEVANYIYDHREDFAGISLLAASGDLDYPQAPFAAVLTKEEIEDEYGHSACHDENVGWLLHEAAKIDGGLWSAVDVAMNKKHPASQAERDWASVFLAYARTCFSTDARRAGHCLKQMHLLNEWNRLKASYVPVDYSLMYEEEDNTEVQQSVACSGGLCHIQL